MKKLAQRGRLRSDIPPRGHSRPAFASIPFCRSALDLQALLSSEAALV